MKQRQQNQFILNQILPFAFLGIILLTLFWYVFWISPKEVPPATPDESLSDTSPKVRGIIAIVIDDFGYRNDVVSEGFLDLDARLTYAVIPGHENSQSFAKNAQNVGYEVIIHMPMESHVASKGEAEYRLMTEMTSAEIEEVTERAFSHLPQAIGMNNHQGSKATEDPRVMRVVSDVLLRHQSYFVDSRTTSNTIAQRVMDKAMVPNIRRHVFLDNDFDPGLIYKQLNELALLAEEQGMAVGIGHVKKETLHVLKEEIPKMKEQGFQFRFVSEIINQELQRH
ncbi:MAG: divergent polysaccharide deacetylase family protein [Candidatus Marinimicrobia bacterium]|nr:divergent polysaccharide deacetylase family protein [Candidatus Neomarinimicrobiota bacterium]